MHISGQIPNINSTPLSVNAADLAKSFTTEGKTLIRALKSVSTHVATLFKTTINSALKGLRSISLVSLFSGIKSSMPEKTTESVMDAMDAMDAIKAEFASESFYTQQTQALKGNIHQALENIKMGCDTMNDRRKITTNLAAIGLCTCGEATNSNVKNITKEFLQCNVVGMQYSQYGSTDDIKITTEQKAAYAEKTQEIKVWADSL